jgi:RES domain-containing protein
VTAPLDEDVVQHVNDAGTTAWSGLAYRFTNARRDPLSGEGSYEFGGRWNPRGVFAAIYLALPQATAMLEFQRRAEAAAMDPLDMLRAGYILHTIEVHDLPVLDLRDEQALAAVGLGQEDITAEDWTACQSVGHAAWFLEYGGVLAPSAAGHGFVLTVFESRLEPRQLTVNESIRLDPATYEGLIADSRSG